MRQMKCVVSLLLGIALLATSGCISRHLVRDKAQAHVEYSLADGRAREVEGQPGYYALLPLSVAGDIVTSPLQVVYFLATDRSHWGSANIHGVPVPLP